MGLLDIFRRKNEAAPPAPEPAPPAPPKVLSDDGLLVSDLLIDRPDALEEIERRREQGLMDDEQAAHLQRMVKDGYTVVELDLGPEVFAAFDSAVEGLWRDKPTNVAYAYHSLLTRFSDALDEHRKPSYRIADLHSYDPTALDLFLHPTLSKLVELVFGEPGVAIQSLYFEWGSQQALHRDPVHVSTRPPSHLLAAWIALEDIGPDCGPLVYVPGSHRLPYYQYEPGQYTFKHGVYGDAEARASEAWDQEQCARHGLAARPFTGPRGKAFLWHHSLLHGGSYPVDRELTRKSFVVHYSTRSTQQQVLNSYQGWSEPGRQGEASVQVLASEKKIVRGEREGFVSPLAAADT